MGAKEAIDSNKTLVLTEVPPTVHLIGPGALSCHHKLVNFTGMNHSTLCFDPRPVSLICLYGKVNTNTIALRKLADQQISVALLSSRGRRCFGTFQGITKPKLSLQSLQLSLAKSEQLRLAWAKKLVHQKGQSILDSVRRFQRLSLIHISEPTRPY